MIVFTKHASTKLRQRGISETTVLKTLRDPDHVAVGSSNRKIAYKKFNHLYLKVIFKKENKNFIVITQYWTGAIK